MIKVLDSIQVNAQMCVFRVPINTNEGIVLKEHKVLLSPEHTISAMYVEITGVAVYESQ
jgi:hypothetical protein